MKCPECQKELIYKKSSFEQYEPSSYLCGSCGKSFNPTHVEIWNKQQDVIDKLEAENEKLRECLYYAVEIIDSTSMFNGKIADLSLFKKEFKKLKNKKELKG